MIELGCLSFCELEEWNEIEHTLSKKLIGVLKKSHGGTLDEKDLQIQKLVEIKAIPALSLAG